MKRAAIYCRVSSDKQAQEGDSIPAQLDALRRYVKEHNYHLVGEYVDDGVSGQKIDRDELQRLLDDVQAGKVELILFCKLDRWFRSIRHYVRTQEILDRFGVQWVAIWEPIYDTTTPQGRLIVNQMLSIAQFEAENTGARIKQVFDYKVKQGEVISGNTALGHRIENKHIVLSEDAPIVLDLFEHYNFVGNLAELSRYAAETYGLKREPSTWRSFLKNKKYIGEFKGNPNYCPPIVSKDLFEAVQRRLRSNVKDVKGRDVYLFTGMLVCYGCGKIMTGVHICYRSTAGVPHKYRGYRCHRRYSPVGECSGSRIRFESTLEKYLVAHVADMAKEYKLTVEVGKKRDTSKDVAKLQKKIDRLKELYVNGLIDLDEYKADKEKYLSQIDELKQQPTDKLDMIAELDFESFYWTMTDEEKRFLWQSIIKEIHWDKNGKIDVIFLT